MNSAQLSGAPLDAAALATLSTWLSPAYPIGAFAYSQGLEQAIADGAAHDAQSACDWIGAVLRFGPGRADAALLGMAHRAAAAADWAALEDVAALAASLAPGAERRLETFALGAAFHRATAAVWPNAAAPKLAARAAATGGAGLAYPVAVGAQAGALGLPLGALALLFAQSAAATLISVAVRLVPLGQTDGLRILRASHPAVAEAAGAAETAADSYDPAGAWEAADLAEMVGGCAFGADIAAMRHETLETRIFRT